MNSETLSLKSWVSDPWRGRKLGDRKMKPPAYNAEEVQQISQEQGERNVAMAVCVQLAGRAIIRVVSRCEQAQDNCDLGKRIIHFLIFKLNQSSNFIDDHFYTHGPERNCLKVLLKEKQNNDLSLNCNSPLNTHYSLKSHIFY